MGYSQALSAVTKGWLCSIGCGATQARGAMTNGWAALSATVPDYRAWGGGRGQRLAMNTTVPETIERGGAGGVRGWPARTGVPSRQMDMDTLPFLSRP